MRPITFLWVLAVLLATLPTTAAFGMSPASTSLQSPEQQTINLLLYNSKEEHITLRLSVDEEIKDFVTLSTERIEFTRETKEVVVQVTINTPLGVLPGIYTGGILVEQEPPMIRTDFVTAVPATRHRITIEIPPEGKHLEARLSTSAPEAGREVLVTLHVKNKGTENIDVVNAEINVRSPNNELLNTITIDSTSLAVGEERALIARWTPENPGWYGLQGIVDYDGQTAYADMIIEVGTLSLSVGELEFDFLGEYKLGDTIKTSLPVTSNWNSIVANTHSTHTLTQGGRKVAEFTSLSEDIPPRGNVMLQSYWDTTGFTPGTYEVESRVYYGDRSQTKISAVVFGLDTVSTPSVPERLSAWIIILLLLVTLTVAFWLMKVLKNP